MIEKVDLLGRHFTLDEAIRLALIRADTLKEVPVGILRAISHLEPCSREPIAAINGEPCSCHDLVALITDQVLDLITARKTTFYNQLDSLWSEEAARNAYLTHIKTEVPVIYREVDRWARQTFASCMLRPAWSWWKFCGLAALFGGAWFTLKQLEED